jgi:hypothetical protein
MTLCAVFDRRATSVWDSWARRRASRRIFPEAFSPTGEEPITNCLWSVLACFRATPSKRLGVQDCAGPGWGAPYQRIGQISIHDGAVLAEYGLPYEQSESMSALEQLVNGRVTPLRYVQGRRWEQW